MLAAGTIRINRFNKPPLCSDVDMKSNGRGAADEVISGDGKVIVTKWYDNKTVHLASNFIGIGEMDIAQRFDKKTRQSIGLKSFKCII